METSVPSLRPVGQVFVIDETTNGSTVRVTYKVIGHVDNGQGQQVEVLMVTSRVFLNGALRRPTTIK